MELIFIVLWTVVVLLGYQLSVPWKTHGSFPQILKKLPHQIRSVLGVVGDRELKNIQEIFIVLSSRSMLGRFQGQRLKNLPSIFKNVLKK